MSISKTAKPLQEIFGEFDDEPETSGVEVEDALAKLKQKWGEEWGNHLDEIEDWYGIFRRYVSYDEGIWANQHAQANSRR